jgi:hypothetical protein
LLAKELSGFAGSFEVVHLLVPVPTYVKHFDEKKMSFKTVNLLNPGRGKPGVEIQRTGILVENIQMLIY